MLKNRKPKHIVRDEAVNSHDNWHVNRGQVTAFTQLFACFPHVS